MPLQGRQEGRSNRARVYSRIPSRPCSCAAGLMVRAEQQGAGAMQAGHDRSDWHARYLGDFAVTKLVQLIAGGAKGRRFARSVLVENRDPEAVFAQRQGAPAPHPD